MAIDDQKTVVALDVARDIFRASIEAHGGRVIDMAGDSILAAFETAAGAVQAALDAQQQLASRPGSSRGGPNLLFRIGVHLGDVIEKADGSVYGDGVNVAARLQALADPGRIVVSQAIQGTVRQNVRATFVDLGEHEVKNIAQPVHAYGCDFAATEIADDTKSVAVNTPSLNDAASQRRALRFGLSAVAAVAICGAMAAGWFAFKHLPGPTTVAPYSVADRRMTFAVLPSESPKGDVEAEGLAASAREAVQALQEARFLFARVAPWSVVQQAVAVPATAKQLGSTLNVHFLLRGNVAREASGYTLNLAVIDADSERVLEAKTLRSEPTSPPTFNRREIDSARSRLTLSSIRAEVARAQLKPDSSLDFRDLTLRAFVDRFNEDLDPATSYARAKKSLDRALAMAPDDLLTLKQFAEINLCACLTAWASKEDIRAMESIGVAAMDKYLAIRPDDVTMLGFRGDLFRKHGRYDEALLVFDAVLRREPASVGGLSGRAVALLKLGRIPEALAAAQAWLAVSDGVESNYFAAYAFYAARDDASSIRYAKRAISLTASRDLGRPDRGDAWLVLAAAEVRSGHVDRARLALRDFYAAVPSVRTIAQIRDWLLPEAFERDDKGLLDGLRQAGATD